MKVTELINKAWILSGIVSRGLQQVSSEQGTDGLFWFNEMLAEKSISGRQVPYYTDYQSNYIKGQETYFIPNLIFSDAVTFNIGEIRYQLQPKLRRDYRGENRVDNIQSLPVYYYEERVNGGCNLQFYFFPVDAYVFNVTGRFMPRTDFTLSEELDTSFDKYYQLFLLYDLAIYLCNWYKAPVPPMTQLKWMDLSKKVNDINYQDLTRQSISTLGGGGALNYAEVNLGKSWVVG